MPGAAQARGDEVYVDAHCAPWDPVVNPRLAFGSGYYLRAKVIFSPPLVGGAKITFKASGSASWIVNCQRLGQRGDSSFTSDRSVTLLPSHFIGRRHGTVKILGLVGAPFVIGESATVAASAGAAAISVGLNDDMLFDNNGGFKVEVHVPEADTIVEAKP